MWAQRGGTENHVHEDTNIDLEHNFDKENISESSPALKGQISEYVPNLLSIQSQHTYEA